MRGRSYSFLHSELGTEEASKTKGCAKNEWIITALNP